MRSVRDMKTSTTLEALRVIERALDSVDTHERECLPHAQRVELMQLGRRVGKRLDALVGVLVGEADAAGSAMASRGTPLRSLLSAAGQESSKEAAAQVFAGRDLVSREATRDAALAGDITVRQARAVTKTMDHLPAALTPAQRQEAERKLLERAATATPEQIAKAGESVLAEVAPELAESPEAKLQRLDRQRARARARRSLSFLSDGDGSILIRGSLPELDAAPFCKLIEAQVESQRRASRERRDRRDVLDQDPSPEQRRADALVALVSALHEGSRTPRVGGDRPRVVVLMDERGLRERVEQVGVLESGAEIATGDLRRLCCDAEVLPVVLGGRSEVLDVGASIRLVTPPMRAALNLRDGGCVFPGCEVPATTCEAHHITPWWAGGPTALENLVLLCSHHHQVVEPARFWSGPPPDRWQIRLDAEGLPEAIPPARMDKNRTPLKCGSWVARIRPG